MIVPRDAMLAGGGGFSTGKTVLITLILAVVLIATVWFMSRVAGADVEGKDSKIPKLRPHFFFWLGMTYLLALTGIFFVYNANFFNVQKTLTSVFGPSVPPGVPFFGALGAVLISLQGVFDHKEGSSSDAASGSSQGEKGADSHDPWDSAFNYWHISRPLLGAVMATIAFFILVTVVKTTGATALVPATSPVVYVSAAPQPPSPLVPTPSPEAASTPGAASSEDAINAALSEDARSPSPSSVNSLSPSLAPVSPPITVQASPAPAALATTAATQPSPAANPFPYYVLAFVIGYREARFRDLLKKAGDLFFGSGEEQ